MSSSFDAALMLQRQMEVSGMLRNPLKTAEDLTHIRGVVSRLVDFISKVGRVATKLQLPLELVFQCLMQMGYTGAASFDRQHRDGNVPMHQAKVLNRESATQIEPQVRAAVPEETLNDYVQLSQTMRAILRMKVEDGNDLSMARRAIAIADDYFKLLALATQGDEAAMWRAYNADDEQQLKAAVGAGGGAGGSSSFGGDGNGEDNCGPALPPPPANLASAITKLAAPSLLSVTSPVADRQHALAVIDHWVQCASHKALPSHGTHTAATYAALKAPLRTQLGEKRSALLRAACAIVTVLLKRSDDSCFYGSEVKDAITAWCETLLKQVHVTVAAIATANDALMRDIIVATSGAAFVLQTIGAALAKASQPELQRKCLNYVCLCIVTSTHDTDHKAQLSAPIAKKFSGSSTEAVRRVARVLGILLMHRDGSVSLGWDEKVLRSAAAESAGVIHMRDQGAAVFEVDVLKYPEPCPVSQNPVWEIPEDAPATASASVSPTATEASTRKKPQLPQTHNNDDEPLVPVVVAANGSSSNKHHHRQSSSRQSDTEAPLSSPIVPQHHEQYRPGGTTATAAACANGAAGSSSRPPLPRPDERVLKPPSAGSTSSTPHPHHQTESRGTPVDNGTTHTRTSSQQQRLRQTPQEHAEQQQLRHDHRRQQMIEQQREDDQLREEEQRYGTNSQQRHHHHPPSNQQHPQYQEQDMPVKRRPTPEESFLIQQQKFQQQQQQSAQRVPQRETTPLQQQPQQQSSLYTGQQQHYQHQQPPSASGYHHEQPQNQHYYSSAHTPHMNHHHHEAPTPVHFQQPSPGNFPQQHYQQRQEPQHYQQQQQQMQHSAYRPSHQPMMQHQQGNAGHATQNGPLRSNSSLSSDSTGRGGSSSFASQPSTSGHQFHHPQQQRPGHLASLHHQQQQQPAMSPLHPNTHNDDPDEGPTPFSPDAREQVVPLSLLSNGLAQRATPPTGNLSGSLKKRVASGTRR